MIERSEISREIVRFGVGRNGCRSQTDAARYSRQRGEQRDGLEPNDIGRMLTGRRAQCIGEEEHVELAALRGLGDLAGELKIDSSCLCLRHPPARHVMPCANGEKSKMHWGFAIGRARPPS